MKKLLLVFIGILTFSSLAGAQEIPWWQNKKPYWDSTNDGRVTQEINLHYKKIDQIYVGAATASLILAVRYPKYNTDQGGYNDIWLSGDKGAHFAAHWMLATAAIDAGMDGWKAASLGCVYGMGYEWVQRYNGEIHKGSGFSSKKDIVMNCSGSFAAWGYKRVVKGFRKPTTEKW
jgi:hypothetical protein